MQHMNRGDFRVGNRDQISEIDTESIKFQSKDNDSEKRLTGVSSGDPM